MSVLIKGLLTLVLVIIVIALFINILSLIYDTLTLMFGEEFLDEKVHEFIKRLWERRAKGGDKE